MLRESLQFQAYVFGCLFYLGVVFAVFLIIVHTLLSPLKNKKFLFISKCLLAVCFAAAWFFVNLRVNFGQFRVYAVVAALLGISVYFTKPAAMLAKALRFWYNTAKRKFKNVRKKSKTPI